MPTQIAARAIWEAGDDAQRERWLAAISSGEAIGTLAIDEPHPTAEEPRTCVAAVRDGHDWNLTGSKWFVPDAATADLLVVAAATDPAAGTIGETTTMAHDELPHDLLMERLAEMAKTAVPVYGLNPESALTMINHSENTTFRIDHPASRARAALPHHRHAHHSKPGPGR